MKRQITTESDFPMIVVEVRGNLRLKGVDVQEVVGSSHGEDDLVIEQRQDQIYVECKKSVNLQVPRNSEIKVEIVTGNASFKDLEGKLEIHRITGNVELRNVGSTQIDEVKGNLLARNTDGHMNITSVYGNASVEGIQGAFIVSDSVKGNLNLDEVDGEIKAIARGNLFARFDPLPGHHYHLSSGGNLTCSLLEETSAQVDILKASKVSIGFTSQKVPKQTTAPFQFTLGDGEASINLSAGGVLSVSSTPAFHYPGGYGVKIDFSTNDLPEDIEGEIASQIEAQMEMLGRQLEFQMENLSSTLMGSGLSEEAAERISRKAREASERATKRAQERIQRAQEKIERKVEAARRKAEIKSRFPRKSEKRHDGRTPWKATPEIDPSSPEVPVTDEERLIILRMLEEKKITLEQAEELFSALEGQGE
jgi:hypothetical protein